MSEKRNVRGVGFSHRSDVQEVVDWLDSISPVSRSENVPIADSLGRIVFEDLRSPISVPSFRRAMMDGYAIVADDIQGASPDNPLELQIIDRSMPGHPASVAWPNESLRPAIEIMTGAPIPSGPDAVLPFEKTSSEDDVVFAIDSVPAEKHIGNIGEDICQGDTILSRGHRLRPQDCGIAASVGADQVSVFAKPRVKVLITGNEIVTAGEKRGPYQIFDSNGPMLKSLIERDGGCCKLVKCEDDQESIAQELADREFDLILVSGGSSVGKEDFAPSILAEQGNLKFHGIAMRPSSPTGIGIIEERVVFLLPGNPVSCMCAYDFFAGRLIRRIAGTHSEWPYRKTRLKLQQKISSVIGRVDYCRVKIEENVVTPIAISGASLLSTLSRADGFVIVPRESEGMDAGQAVDVFLFEESGAAKMASSLPDTASES